MGSNYEILEEFQTSTSNASILKKLNTFTSSLCSILEELDNLNFLRIQSKQNLTTLISQHEEPQLVLDEKLKETRNKVEKLNSAIDQIVKQADLTIPTLNHSDNILSSIEDVNNSHLQITNEDSSPELIIELLLEKVMDLYKFPEPEPEPVPESEHEPEPKPKYKYKYKDKDKDKDKDKEPEPYIHTTLHTYNLTHIHTHTHTYT